MRGYYNENLSGELLRRCYELASPRVRQYLEAEIEFVQRLLEGSDSVLELGCGYGRVAFRLAEVAERVVGIDTAAGNIELACRLSTPGSRCEFLEMDAIALTFEDCSFDKVVCVQNGICAFGVNQDRLLREAIRVTRPGGVVLFSSYSEKFWSHRLQWFQAQSDAGLMGPLDYSRTGNGVIACLDGFRSSHVSPDGFHSLCSSIDVKARLTEVDESSLICEISVPELAG